MLIASEGPLQPPQSLVVGWIIRIHLRYVKIGIEL